MAGKTQAVMVMTTVPDEKTADKIAEGLVEGRIAACVQVLSPCQSTYRWQGKVERSQEIPVLVKCTGQNATLAVDEIKRLHPYDVPEAIVVPIQGGLQEYLDWLDQQCGGKG